MWCSAHLIRVHRRPSSSAFMISDNFIQAPSACSFLLPDVMTHYFVAVMKMLCLKRRGLARWRDEESRRLRTFPWSPRCCVCRFRVNPSHHVVHESARYLFTSWSGLPLCWRTCTTLDCSPIREIKEWGVGVGRVKKSQLTGSKMRVLFWRAGPISSLFSGVLVYELYVRITNSSRQTHLVAPYLPPCCVFSSSLFKTSRFP